MRSIFHKITTGKFGIPVLIIVLVGINWLASLYHTRVDFTNEKRFTLSQPTKKLLKQLDKDIEVDIFLKGEFPSAFKQLANSADETLQEFTEIAGSRLRYKFIAPDEQVDDNSPETYADTLAALGLDAINLKSQLKEGEQQQLVYPAAIVRCDDKMIPVDLYSGDKTVISPAELNSAEALMEYKFADAIEKSVATTKPLIAYSIGNGEPTGPNVEDLVQNVLLTNYNLQTIKINEQPFIPDTFKLLIVVKPTIPFTDDETQKIDQYVMRGGKVLWFIDELNAEMDSLQIKNEVIAYDRGLGLNDLLFKYGVRINPSLIMDLQCDYLPMVVNGNNQMDYLHWNYFPLFESKSDNLIDKNIGLVAGQFVNSIDTVEADGIKKTVLLSSSDNSRVIGTPALISARENSVAPEDDKFKQSGIPAAVLLEGKFESMYKYRASQAMKDSLAKYGEPLLDQCVEDNKMIVVADGDIPLNSMTTDKQLLPMGMNRYTYGTQYQYQFANKEFVQNCLDYLINPYGLTEAKGKDYVLRLLDVKKVEDQRLLWQVIDIAGPILLVLLFAVIYQWWRKKKYVA
jgi:gliding motility-associatede transport system auxiliary component